MPGHALAQSTNTAPANDNFANAMPIFDVWGSADVDNTLATGRSGETHAGFRAQHSVWFKWTAPQDGEVTLDTMGSTDTFGANLDTVLAVYTGAGLSTLSQVAANDDLYPELQLNYEGQTTWRYSTNNGVLASSGLYSFYQPFQGPSGLKFNARAGTTYYIAVDSKFGTLISGGSFFGVGNVSLHWAYRSSGVFRFATEEQSFVNFNTISTTPELLYSVSESESSRRTGGRINAAEFNSTYHTYYTYDQPGLLVTVTRVGGAAGRVLVDYTTQDGDTNQNIPGDIPAVGGRDYSPLSGTLAFDNYEMSKTLLIPIYDDAFQLSGTSVYEANRDFTISLSNARRDPFEDPSVSPPRVDDNFGQAMVRILDNDIDPKGGSQMDLLVTNPVVTIDTNTMQMVTNDVVTTKILSIRPSPPIPSSILESLTIG